MLHITFTGKIVFLRFLIWQEKENGFLEQEQETYSKKLKVTPRTIVVLMAVEEEKKDASVAAL